MTDKPSIIELPIDQSEQARQPERKNLLAQDVYEKIEMHLKHSYEQLELNRKKDHFDFDESRSHQAILIDGGRGTGKSSVLVNLATYMGTDSDYLILKPVDPTLLENGDDLLLNVIVAALVRDKSVRRALQDKESLAEAFYEQLHKLGNALEGIQKQKEQYGLDKLRSFMGNQGLAELVHELLKKTLLLTDKKLIVMPIDDVDTSLQLAFENIEVLRKYLTSPYIVPIISGDLNLYNEVIWREFYSRLTQKAKATVAHAQLQARDLAEEYQRKVLPLPRRIQLPQLSSYLKDQNIILKNGENLFSLPTLKSWLDALLNERVNGEENSQLNIPINTVREMAQFINAAQILIPNLTTHLPINELEKNPAQLATTLKRLVFMNEDVARNIAEFETDYGNAFYLTTPRTSQSQKNRNNAYTKLKDSTKNLQPELSTKYKNFKRDWYKIIANYFFYQRNSAATFLVAKTNIAWIDESKTSDDTPVLSHDLFQPLNHQLKQFEHFDSTAKIKTEWTKALKTFAPQIWLERLPLKSLLAYPIPEKGSSIWRSIYSGPWAFDDYSREKSPINSGQAELVRQLMTHWSFYSSSKQSNQILTGRLFELITTSLVRDLNPVIVMKIFNRAPFYSVISLADTKTFNIEDNSTEQEDKTDANIHEAGAKDDVFKQAVANLVEDINEWREKYKIQPPHSWLIYNIMNKTFNQINQPNWQPKQSDTSMIRLKTVVDTSIKAFHTIWATFGSFEKGETFGFPRIIANINMSDSDKDFEKNELFRQNILPFIRKDNDHTPIDFKTNSYTFALASHPLRALFYAVQKNLNIEPINSKKETNQPLQNNKNGKKIDKIFNTIIKRFKIEKNERSISNLPLETLRNLLLTITSACREQALSDELRLIKDAPDLPPRSGRKYLQYCINTYDRLHKAELSSEQKS